MDRHDVSEEVTAEVVADLHQKDLRIQHNFNCKGLTYWFDAGRKTAFCLVEAPDRMAIQEMHDHAHGEVGHRIIEVDAAVVESFLGRIEDPVKSQNTDLNIINDPAFRIIMVGRIKWNNLADIVDSQSGSVFDNYYKSIFKVINKFKGGIVKLMKDYFLVSFDSVTNAVRCGLEVQEEFNHSFSNNCDTNIQLQIGLSAGVPVSDKDGIFEDTIRMADFLCNVIKGQIVVSSEVKELYESENRNIPLDRQQVNVLPLNDELFLNKLMDYTEREWSNARFNVEDFSRSVGYSKSQLYRKMISLTGKSPNRFIRDYRLDQALKLLNKKVDNISEVAYKTGFNKPAYFSKCFHDVFGILPSHYLKSIDFEYHTNVLSS